MPFPTDTLITAGTIVRVQKSFANRTLPIITLTASAAGSTGNTSLGIAAATAPAGLIIPTGGVLVQQGTSLTFNSTTPQTVVLSSDVLVGDTTINFAGTTLTGAIASANLATTNGLLQVLGGDSADLSITDKEVSTRGFENGIYDDARKVMIGGSLNWQGFYRVGDPSINQVIEPASQSAAEIFVQLIYPDKKFRSFYAFIKGFKEQSKLDDIRRLNWEFRAVGTITTGTLP